MNASGAVLSLILVTVVYLGTLVWMDTQGGLMSLAPALPGVLGVLVLVAIASWVVRFCRWHWLMRRAGFSPAWWPAWLAYLSGFSFTATPGKAGELIRIRYFEPLGVPARLVVGLFVYERCFDLLVVLLLAMIAMNQFEQFWIAAGFVLTLVAVVVMAASNGALARIGRVLAKRNLGGMARVLETLDCGLVEARRWVKWNELAVSLTLGLAAWGMLALSFCWLLGRLGIDLPLSTSIAIYPLSMLVGAASMLPGGLGSTEATIVALLALNQAPLDVALLAAVAARLSTLWAAIAFGLVALVWSEAAKVTRARPS